MARVGVGKEGEASFRPSLMLPKVWRLFYYGESPGVPTVPHMIALLDTSRCFENSLPDGHLFALRLGIFCFSAW